VRKTFAIVLFSSVKKQQRRQPVQLLCGDFKMRGLDMRRFGGKDLPTMLAGVSAVKGSAGNKHTGLNRR
jgi:hypothetical protein